MNRSEFLKLAFGASLGLTTLRSYGFGSFQAEGPFTSHFVVEEGGAPIGSVRRRSLFQRRADLRISDVLPLGVQTFLFGLVVLEWRRSARRRAG